MHDTLYDLAEALILTTSALIAAVAIIFVALSWPKKR